MSVPIFGFRLTGEMQGRWPLDCAKTSSIHLTLLLAIATIVLVSISIVITLIKIVLLIIVITSYHNHK